MLEFVKIIDGIKTDGLTRPSYLLGNDIPEYDSYLVRIREILKIFRNTGAILESNAVPLILVNKFTELFGDFKAAHLDPFTQGIPETTETANNYRQGMNNVKKYHNDFFQISSSNYSLFLIDAIDNYKFQDSKLTEAKANQIIKDLQEAQKNFESLTEKIAAESTKKVITNYAGIFRTQETKHGTESKKWLYTSIIISIVFLALFISSIIWSWFPINITLTDIRDGHKFTNELFNIPLLVSKIVVISFILFLIPFCFRQYAINKNLQVINEQRKNAIDSYELFAASAGSDNVAKNVLLTQLARSIYQMTHTGFLSNKQSDPSNNQLFELTRFIQGDNK
jgi:hypothetical protein